MSEEQTMKDEDKQITGCVLEATEGLYSIKKRRIDDNGPECGINMLNDDCLLNIFSYLSIYDHLALDKVCRGWKNLMKGVWSRRTVLDIDDVIKNKLPGTSGFSFHMLDTVLSRCGPNLKTIKLSDKTHGHYKRIHEVIAKYGRYLEELDLSAIVLDESCIEEITQSCNNLRKINFDVDGIGHLNKLFSKHQYLDSVCVETEDSTNIELFKHLNQNLKEFKLSMRNHCGVINYRIKDNYLQSGLKTFKYLEVLWLNSCKGITPDCMKDIANMLPNLKSLSLNGYYTNEKYYRLLEPIKHLHQLKYLSIYNNYAVNDTILELISVSCRDLEVLDISCVSMQTVTELFHISKLTKLRELSLCSLDAVCTESIAHLATALPLQVLRVGLCRQFDDEAALSVLTHCEGLTFLSMDGCKKITGTTITNAVNVLKARSRRKSKLTLEVGDTAVNKVEVVEQHPLLELEDGNSFINYFLEDLELNNYDGELSEDDSDD